MRLRRSITAFLLLVSLLGGLYVQLSSSQHGWVSAIDRALAPVQQEKFQVGAKVADPPSPGQRGITIRKVLGPTPVKLDYLLCSIDDDPEQINAFGLYHPADLAITCLNLQNLGIQRSFIATHLHWPDLDIASNGTLSTAIGQFKQAVIATPLRRQFTASPISPAFFRSSVPLSSIDGDVSLFPIVNHQSHPPTIEVPENTWIGFSKLESETDVESLPLLARWDQRIVFYAPLLHLIQEAGATLNEVRVEPGSFIRLGNAGHFIPIDAFGRFHPNSALTTPQAARQISSAMSANTSIIGARQEAAIITARGMDTDRFAAVEAPLDQLTQLLHTPRAGNPETVKRLPVWAEITLLFLLSLLGVRCSGYSFLRSSTSYLTIIILLWVVLLILYHSVHLWTPMSSYLSALLICWTLSTILAKPLARS